MDSLLNPDFSKYLTQQNLSVILKVAIWILIGIPLVRLAVKWIKKIGRDKISDQQSMVFQKIVLYTGYVIIIFSVLSIFGFEISTLLGAAGIIGIAVGFASQTSVSNIISGWFLIAEKPFEINDVISVMRRALDDARGRQSPARRDRSDAGRAPDPSVDRPPRPEKHPMGFPRPR